MRNKELKVLDPTHWSLQFLGTKAKGFSHIGTIPM